MIDRVHGGDVKRNIVDFSANINPLGLSPKTKAAITENLFGKKEIINIELQAEPWLQKRPPDVALEEQLKVFSLEQFKENIEYAKAVGFEKIIYGV